MAANEDTEVYLKFLSEEGFSPRVDEDGDIVFKYEGGTYLILCSDDENEYFRLAFPAFWSIDSDEERVQVTMAAHQATANTKVAKVFISGDNTWAAIEMFIGSPQAVTPVLPRCLRALQTAVHNFTEAMASFG